MKARDLTQADAAKQIGVSRSYLTRVLAGDREASLAFALGARDAFGIEPSLFHAPKVATASAGAKRRGRPASKVPSRRVRAGETRADTGTS